jgi:hypothetical protein
LILIIVEITTTQHEYGKRLSSICGNMDLWLKVEKWVGNISFKPSTCNWNTMQRIMLILHAFSHVYRSFKITMQTRECYKKLGLKFGSFNDTNGWFIHTQMRNSANLWRVWCWYEEIKWKKTSFMPTPWLEICIHYVYWDFYRYYIFTSLIEMINSLYFLFWTTFVVIQYHHHKDGLTLVIIWDHFLHYRPLK